MSILGIDIGTTTITALLLDEKHGKIINKTTLKNESFIDSNFDFEKIFNFFRARAKTLMRPRPCCQ